MTVLVTAASKHGATHEIAEEIARVLDEHGVSTELLDIDEVTDLSSYEAYVVGSGIYLGNWLKNARRFLDTYAAALAQRPTWLFASGSIVGEPPVADDPDALRPGLVERLVETAYILRDLVAALDYVVTGDTAGPTPAGEALLGVERR